MQESRLGPTSAKDRVVLYLPPVLLIRVVIFLLWARLVVTMQVNFIVFPFVSLFISGRETLVLPPKYSKFSRADSLRI